MDIKHRLISVDDRVHEHPDVWTQRMSASRWGDNVPHLERQPNGGDCWVLAGQTLPLGTVADVGALMPDRTSRPNSWEDLPKAAYDPSERLAALDVDGVDYSVLYPTVAGAAGETFGRITDPDLELACVQAYNDWLIEEWAGTSPRFIPQCIVPLAPISATVQEIKRPSRWDTEVWCSQPCRGTYVSCPISMTLVMTQSGKHVRSLAYPYASTPGPAPGSSFLPISASLSRLHLRWPPLLRR